MFKYQEMCRYYIITVDVRTVELRKIVTTDVHTRSLETLNDIRFCACVSVID